MRPPRDLTAQRFGRLTALRRSKSVMRGGESRTAWRFACDCGREIEALTQDVVSGDTASCGCLHRDVLSKLNFRHGETGTAEYRTWRYMMSRCHNRNAKGFCRYGGRGITVCERWRSSFTNFLADMGARPSSKHSIERDDNEKGYEPGNCRWATAREQARNRRSTTWVKLNGARTSLPGACDALGLDLERTRERRYRHGVLAFFMPTEAL